MIGQCLVALMSTLENIIDNNSSQSTWHIADYPPCLRVSCPTYPVLVKPTSTNKVVRHLADKCKWSEVPKQLRGQTTQLGVHLFRYQHASVWAWLNLRPEHTTVRRLQIHLTIARLPYGSLVVPWLNAKLEDNRESFELRKVHPSGVDHSLDRVDHLVREVGDLHQEGYHAWEESQGPWMLTEEVEKVRPGICFQHVGLCMTVDWKFSQVKQLC